jgi:hypothetical protein
MKKITWPTVLHFEWICWRKLTCMVLHGFLVPALINLCFPIFAWGWKQFCGLAWLAGFTFSWLSSVERLFLAVSYELFCFDWLVAWTCMDFCMVSRPCIDVPLFWVFNLF